MKLPPVIMTPEEIEQAEEDSLELERDWLDNYQKPKLGRTRTVEPHTMRTKEAAKYLGISEWKLRAMAHGSEIPYIRQKYFLFSVDDLNAWINRNKESEELL